MYDFIFHLSAWISAHLITAPIVCLDPKFEPACRAVSGSGGRSEEMTHSELCPLIQLYKAKLHMNTSIFVYVTQVISLISAIMNFPHGVHT